VSTDRLSSIVKFTFASDSPERIDNSDHDGMSENFHGIVNDVIENGKVSLADDWALNSTLEGLR
jgi:hypothetical protein